MRTRDLTRSPGEPLAERRARQRRGLVAEQIAALLLIAKGYRILGRRVRTGAGEIDLIARRRQRLAFVEVKRRASLSDCEAAITDRQRRRVRRAADLWLARRASLQTLDLAFDLVFIVPKRLPQHIANGL